MHDGDLMRALVASSVVAAGCLSAPSLGQPKCNKNSDCPIGGEVCDQNVCWGAPPAAMFAATIAPPAERTDLVATELPQVAIGQDGWIDGLALDTPVSITGSVLPYCPQTPCATTPVAARIELVRPSRIVGLPGRAFTATTDPTTNTAGSFELLVAPTGPSDPPYVVTIVPDPSGRKLDSAPTNTTAAQLYPPLRLPPLVATADMVQQVAVGGPSIVQTGMITDSTGTLLKNYRVVAFGRWDPNEPAREVSTVAYSTDGHYAIALSAGITGGIEIVAQPFDPTVVAATLRLPLLAPDGASHTLAQSADIGPTVAVEVPVVGQAADGSVAAVVGATVLVHADVSPPFGTVRGTNASIVVQTTTDGSGVASLSLPSGTIAYHLQVVPPANSTLGVILDKPFSTNDTGTIQTLPSRIGIHGVVVDRDGKPVGNVAVTATPALRFLWSLDAATLAFLADIPLATTVTPGGGDFVVWVDPYLGNTWGYYDLAFDPPSTSSAPRFIKTQVEIPRVQSLTTLSVDKLTLPDAAFVHGGLVDPTGAPLSGGQLAVYELPTDTTVCAELARTPCILPAVLGGRGTSDSSGTAALTLAR
jgi:hypothetical protein